MSIQGKILYPTDDLKDVYRIRREVFVEELDISEENEMDDIDSYAIHGIAYVDSNKPVAAGRIAILNDCCFLDKLSVLKDHRGKLYGEFILRMLLNKADQSGIHKVYVKGKKPAIHYFERFGFRPDESLKQEDDEMILSLNPKELFLGCKH